MAAVVITQTTLQEIFSSSLSHCPGRNASSLSPPGEGAGLRGSVVIEIATAGSGHLNSGHAKHRHCPYF